MIRFKGTQPHALKQHRLPVTTVQTYMNLLRFYQQRTHNFASCISNHCPHQGQHVATSPTNPGNNRRCATAEKRGVAMNTTCQSLASRCALQSCSLEPRHEQQLQQQRPVWVWVSVIPGPKNKVQRKCVSHASNKSPCLPFCAYLPLPLLYQSSANPCAYTYLSRVSMHVRDVHSIAHFLCPT